MKILIINFYSIWNQGDAAILSVQRAELLKSFPNAQITVSTLQNINKMPVSYRKNFISSFFYLAVYKNNNILFRTFNTMYVLFSSLLWVIIKKYFSYELNFILSNELKNIIYEYKTANLIVSVGGGYINARHTMQSTLSLLLTCHAIYFAQRLKKPVFLYPQSIGPMGHDIQKRMASYTLKNVSHVFIRENESLKFLYNIKFDKNKISKTIDSAFLYKNNSKNNAKEYIKNLGIDLKKPIIGITVRKYLDIQEHNNFENEIVKFIDNLLIKNNNIQILFIPQSTDFEHNDDDRQVNDSIYRKINQTKNVYLISDQIDLNLTKGVYNYVSVLLGTRMHSCIFSLTSNVPVIAIEYEYKTKGIMNDLGLDEWVIKIEDVTADKLDVKFNKLMKQKDKYLKLLNQRLIPYTKIEPPSNFIKEIYDKSIKT